MRVTDAEDVKCKSNYYAKGDPAILPEKSETMSAARSILSIELLVSIIFIGVALRSDRYGNAFKP